MQALSESLILQWQGGEPKNQVLELKFCLNLGKHCEKWCGYLEAL